MLLAVGFLRFEFCNEAVEMPFGESGIVEGLCIILNVFLEVIHFYLLYVNVLYSLILFASICLALEYRVLIVPSFSPVSPLISS